MDTREKSAFNYSSNPSYGSRTTSPVYSGSVTPSDYGSRSNTPVSRPRTPVNFLSSSSSPDNGSRPTTPDIDGSAPVATNSSETVHESNCRATIKQPKCTVIVEPLIAIIFFCKQGSMLFTAQYLYARFAEDFPILHHGGENSSISETCLGINSSAPSSRELRKATQIVQRETSEWIMYIDILSCLPSVVMALVIGGYSDVLYRKPALLIPTLGQVVKVVGLFCVVYWSLPIYSLALFATVEGIFGGYGTLLGVSFSYIADVTHPTQRSFRIVLVGVVLALSGAASEPILGFLIRDFGFKIPGLVIMLFGIVALLYVIFIVPETHIPHPDARFSLKKSLTATWETYTKPGERRPKLFILILLFIFAQAPLIGSQAVGQLYLMNSPLCWDSAMIGIFLAVALFTIQSGSLIGSILVRRSLLSDNVVCLLGCLSGVLGNLYYAFCTTTLMVFFMPLIAAFSLLPTTLARAIGSKLVTAHEQGAFFAGVSVLFNLAHILGSLFFNSVYQATVSVFAGTAFLTMAFSFAIDFILTLTLMMFDIRRTLLRKLTIVPGDSAVRRA